MPISETALHTLFLRQVTHPSFKTWKQIKRNKEATAVSSMKDLYQFLLSNSVRSTLGNQRRYQNMSSFQPEELE